jgi:hypothetical protein
MDPQNRIVSARFSDIRILALPAANQNQAQKVRLHTLWEENKWM